jgi:hypothetical protein
LQNYTCILVTQLSPRKPWLSLHLAFVWRKPLYCPITLLNAFAIFLALHHFIPHYFDNKVYYCWNLAIECGACVFLPASLQFNSIVAVLVFFTCSNFLIFKSVFLFHFFSCVTFIHIIIYLISGMVNFQE